MLLQTVEACPAMILNNRSTRFGNANQVLLDDRGLTRKREELT